MARNSSAGAGSGGISLVVVTEVVVEICAIRIKTFGQGRSAGTAWEVIITGVVGVGTSAGSVTKNASAGSLRGVG